MHLRGPMNVSQLAVYQLPSEIHTMQKRDSIPFFGRRRAMNKRHAVNEAQAILEQDGHLEKRTFNHTTSCSQKTVTKTVTMTDCDAPLPTSSVPMAPNTTYVGPPLPCLPTTSTSTLSQNVSSDVCPCTRSVANKTLSLSTPRQTKMMFNSDFAKRAGSDWNRVAYYASAAPAQATGFSFLANLGDPQKSGTFDYAFGNSLSYVTSDGAKVASDSLPFDGTLDTSEYEIAVFSDKACDQDCPYWRPQATSHFGWSGSSKAFFIEMQMDHYQNRGSDQGLISDAPAWWFLNAAIPRVLQYGNDRNNIPCSCWSTGCGEFDAFEVLGNGEERAKSTMHRQGNLQGGDSNYFKRPVGTKLKFAVV